MMRARSTMRASLRRQHAQQPGDAGQQEHGCDCELNDACYRFNRVHANPEHQKNPRRVCRLGSTSGKRTVSRAGVGCFSPSAVSTMPRTRRRGVGHNAPTHGRASRSKNAQARIRILVGGVCGSRRVLYVRGVCRRRSRQARAPRSRREVRRLHDEECRQRLARRHESVVRSVHVAGASAARSPDRVHPWRRRPGHRLARDAGWPRRLGRLLRRRRLGRLRHRPAGPRPRAEQRELRQRHGARRQLGASFASFDFCADRLAGRRADSDQRRGRRLDGELGDGALLRRRARGGEDLRVARRDRPGRAARAFRGRRQHVPRAEPEPREGRRHHRLRNGWEQSGRRPASTTARR